MLMSQSVSILSNFKRSQSLMACLNMFNGEIIFHFERILKRLCYEKCKMRYKLFSSSGPKKQTSLLMGTKYRMPK